MVYPPSAPLYWWRGGHPYPSGHLDDQGMWSSKADTGSSSGRVCASAAGGDSKQAVAYAAGAASSGQASACTGYASGTSQAVG